VTERAKRAARIRDARNNREEVRAPSGSRKNTRKWCRGVVGRQHEPEIRDYAEYKKVSPRIFSGWRVVICKNCGKELEMCYGRAPKRFFAS